MKSLKREGLEPKRSKIQFKFIQRPGRCEEGGSNPAILGIGGHMMGKLTKVSIK